MAQLADVSLFIDAVIDEMGLDAGQAVDAGLPDDRSKRVPFLVKNIGLAFATNPLGRAHGFLEIAAPAVGDSAEVAALLRAPMRDDGEIV
jgi:hypothetical protein